MATVAPEAQNHREWLGQIQQSGLVVSAQVLVTSSVFVERQRSLETQTRLRERLTGEDAPALAGFERLALEVLEWPAEILVPASELPASLAAPLPEYDDTLTPTFAVRAADQTKAPEGADAWLALVHCVATGVDLDKVPHEASGWRASPHARLERLLREAGVPIGLLFNGTSVRLVYAPRGESSGYLTFRFAHLAQTQGRPMAGALFALLGAERVTDVLMPEQRLPHLLRESRRYQNTVSTELAHQVLGALWELVRGFQRGNRETQGVLLGEVLREQPADVYGGLLTTMMRLVFILYAEDRGLMPEADIYQSHYAVSGLFERLREDQARNPDTMDGRYGAWAQLLVLFRLIHDGGSHADVRFPKRHGRLFDPDAYPFLEGRPHGSHRQLGESIELAKISDGVVYRVLHNLLMLDGERLSYRTLDVEQIGSVYEAMMGFELREAGSASIAVSPKHVVFSIEELLEEAPKDRAGWLKQATDLKPTGEGLAKASSVDEVVAALGKKVSAYTPHVLRVGDLFLQPTEERRRSGSHYTPRSLTEPIVRRTLRPIFERLGDQATPDQILELKVCDPAMGSGAFLVEACRLLGERLVKAWETQKSLPKLPPDEDALTLAKRLVAERCLYGVDKNIFAVDLAKLSLWLATLAKEHPFTFLDHSLRHGDSLVGLSREQIAGLHWAPKQMPLIRSFIDARVTEAQRLRIELEAMGASDDVPGKERLLRDADDALRDVRLMGDVVVSAFFERAKPKERETLRAAYAGQIDAALEKGRDGAVSLNAAGRTTLAAIQDSLRSGDQPVPAFHWHVEFPEVFTRSNKGFDAFVGNPPFAGKNTISASTRDSYLPWLLELHEGSHGNADLVAHFYRRAFNLLRDGGTFGLIATNTIAQGDTRGTGLRWIRHHGGTMYEARKRVKWPGAAAVVVSVTHVAKGFVPPPYVLDGRIVERITAFLFHTGGDDDPLPLKANEGKGFIGSYVLGMGFTFDDTDKNGVASPLSVMHELIQKDPRNADRIFPYIGGEEVNDSPAHAHHRYVINFAQMSEEEARRWPDLMAIVEAKVKSERQALGDNPDGRRRKAFWWQWGRYTPALFEAIRNLDRVMVVCRHQPQWVVAKLRSNAVFAESLVVFAVDEESFLAVLQSQIHECWARSFGSSMKDDLRYTPSDCFETFPFPEDPGAAEALEFVARKYYDYRTGLMERTNKGLTDTYNAFHDSECGDLAIVELRRLHDEMDRAVLEAYGWTDIRLTCEFILDYDDDEDVVPGKGSKKKKPWRYRWPDEIRDEVLGRLLALNAERAATEKSAASAIEQELTRSRKPGPRAKRRASPLFEDHEALD